MRSTSSHSFSSQDDFLPKFGDISNPVSQKEKRLLPIDETEEFHDPFSDLNLFLAKSIKQEILREKNPKKWSHKIASLLFKEILPEFTKKFPIYRLGHTALRKTWEKVRYYLDRFEEEKKALYPDGKLNIEYLIKKNLASWKSKNASTDTHPYHTASLIALKISECIALINGERASLEKLTDTIWSMQKHLLPKKEIEKKAPITQYDPLDKIITGLQLEELAKNPILSSSSLQKAVHTRLEGLQEIEKIRSIDDLHPYLASFLAETLDRSPLSMRLSFVTEKNIEDILFLAPFVHKLSKKELEENLQASIHYVSSLSKGTCLLYLPVIREEIFQFIDRKKESKNLLSSLLDLFEKMEKCPLFQELSPLALEIFLWKHIEKPLPDALATTLSTFLASTHIENPEISLSETVQETLKTLKKIKGITFSHLEEKVHLWSLQHDMAASTLPSAQDSPLLALLQQLGPLPLSTLQEKVRKAYPILSSWEEHLSHKVIFLYKHLWYTAYCQENESAHDRFLAWHQGAPPALLEKMVPLMPLS